MIGRDGELAQLERALNEAAERGGAMLVTGPAGIGKTSLLDAVANQARSRGFRVLSVTGLESEAELPYAGLHQLLQPALSSTSKLAAPQRNALMTALGMRSGAPPDVFLVGLATLNLLDQVGGENPLLLVADDFHWLDGPTASVLGFVARRLEATHVLLLVGMRDNFNGALRSSPVPEIEVGPLSDAAATELLAAVAPDLDAQTRRLILAEALGNPLGLVELARAFRLFGADGREGALRSIPLTDRLERTFIAEARRLSKPTQSALLLVAVDKDPTVRDVLDASRVMDGEEVTLDVLQPAVDAGLISIGGLTVRYRHPLIRAAVEHSASAQQRRNAHVALAEVIADPDRRAWHRAKAIVGEDERAAADLEAAAGRAQDRGATATAVGALELAASLTPRGPAKARRLLAAAQLAFQLGDPPAVGRLLDATSSLDLTPNDLARVALLREIFHDGTPGDPDAVAGLVATARDAAAQGDKDLALNLLQGAALRCWWSEPGALARRNVIDALRDIEADELDPKAIEILSLASPVDSGNRVSERVSVAAATLQSDAPRTLVLAVAAHGVGDFTQALELLRRAGPGLRAEGRLGLLAQQLNCQAWIETHVGNFTDAARDGEEGNRVAIETEQPIWIAASEISLARLAGLRGDEAEAQSLLHQAESRVAPLRLSNLLSAAQLVRGLTALTAGRSSDAYEHFARMFDPDDIAFNEVESYAASGYVIASAIQAGRREEAAHLQVELESLGRRSSAALLHAGLRCARAMLAVDSDAEQLWEIALRSDPRWAFDRAFAQLLFGAWLRRQRRITASRPHLRAARDAFEALGAKPWAEKARTELRASGERAAARFDGPREPLSPQELQIAQMAAGGLSNREIADRLFISHRTVGAHLYRVFPKLGVASRSDLSRALAAAGVYLPESQGGV